MPRKQNMNLKKNERAKIQPFIFFSNTISKCHCTALAVFAVCLWVCWWPMSACACMHAHQTYDEVLHCFDREKCCGTVSPGRLFEIWKMQADSQPFKSWRRTIRLNGLKVTSNGSFTLMAQISLVTLLHYTANTITQLLKIVFFTIICYS